MPSHEDEDVVARLRTDLQASQFEDGFHSVVTSSVDLRYLLYRVAALESVISGLRQAVHSDETVWVDANIVRLLLDRLDTGRNDLSPEEVYDAECGTCGEDFGEQAKCPGSKRSCGHHCNCVWIHDECHWCPAYVNEDGEFVTDGRNESDHE
jgi:hypothetical protein